MAEKLPRVLGLAELLATKALPREKPAPLIYFTDREFTRLLKGVDELKRAPRSTFGRPTFIPIGGGGVVQSSCSSPPGQICVGQWIPAGPTHGSGIFFGCRCRPVLDQPPPPPVTCQVKLDEKGFSCVGDCGTTGSTCQLGYWRDPKSGLVTLDCRCRPRLKA
jgi:hypothetical protein